MIVTLTGATVKESGKNKWLLVQYTDDKGQAREKNIFATQGDKKVEGYDELAKLIEKGEARGKSFDLEMTKTTKDDKTYWNVIAIKEVGAGKPERQKPAFTPSDDNKPRSMALNTELTKLRSMLVSYAKDLAVVDKIAVAEIISHAEVWEGYVLGSVGQPQSPPEAPQSAGKLIEPPKDSVVEEAIELGGEVIPSAEEVKSKVSKLIEANKTLKVGTFVAMMEKLQVGVTEKSEKNKFGNATLVGVYQALSDDSKIKFNKQIG